MNKKSRSLLLPLKDLEAIWAWGLERYGSNRVQTNGTLIQDEHVALFHKYGVRVGISLDGPGELNDVRWHGEGRAGVGRRRGEATAD